MGNQHNSDIVSECYLHKVKIDSEFVKGVLVKLNLTKENCEKFIPHENIDKNKVLNIKSAYLSDKLDEIPVVLGVFDEEFSRILESESKEQDFVNGRIINIKDNILNLKEFFLADGHHRYAAAKKLLQFGLNVHLWFWLVPFNKLKINSFVKTFISDPSLLKIFLSNRDYKRYIKKPSNPVEEGFEILIYFDGSYYQKTFSNEEVFLGEIEYLTHDIEKKRLSLINRIEVLDHRDITKINKNNNDCFHLSHTHITHKMLRKIIINKKVLPLHTTCFNPKPERVPEEILLLNKKYSSLDIRNSVI